MSYRDFLFFGELFFHPSFVVVVFLVKIESLLKKKKGGIQEKKVVIT
jgi:hypothetical protein